MGMRLTSCRRHLCSQISLTTGFRKKMEVNISNALERMESQQIKRPFRVSIEGNIGAGKSTLIKYFNRFPGIETYGEPIDHWRNVNGDNLLELLYSDIHKWLRVFQNYVQLTRLKVQTSKPKNPNTTVQMFERSIQNNRFCFVELAYKNGYLDHADYVVLDEWYQWIQTNIDIDLDLIVYLKSTPEVVFERIRRRGRPEEKGISLEYLTQLHESHEEWLIKNRNNSVPVLIMDADKTLEEVYEQFKENEKQILGFNRGEVGAINLTNKDL